MQLLCSLNPLQDPFLFDTLKKGLEFKKVLFSLRGEYYME